MKFKIGDRVSWIEENAVTLKNESVTGTLQHKRIPTVIQGIVLGHVGTDKCWIRPTYENTELNRRVYEAGMFDVFLHINRLNEC